MSADRPFERAVQHCYSTWAGSYYDEYYGEAAPYPPVQRDLTISLLRDAGVARLLDAGCGPASFIRDLPLDEIDPYGFDLTGEMVEEAARVIADLGVDPSHVWQGSVLDADAFGRTGVADAGTFDGAVCMGVLPHVPAEADEVVLRNLRDAVRPGGLVVAEARNQLFGMYTLNRYSASLFVDDLIPVDRLREVAGEEAAAVDAAIEELRSMFRLDLPPIRTGKVDEPGYDEVLSRVHNPLDLQQVALGVGLEDVRLHWYHFHALPPMFMSSAPSAARAVSLELERSDDSRGVVMASAFLLVGRRPVS